MSMFGILESGLYKCPLRELNNRERRNRYSKRELERARKEWVFPKKDLDNLAKSYDEEEEDIKKCKEGYDFSGCENCTNEYYLTGHSIECCNNLPRRITT